MQAAEKRVVLIVDDVDQVGSVASEYLVRRMPSLEVFQSTSPAEAIEWLKKAPRVDLVLSDFRMGEIDGLRFLEAARASHPEALFALMTAYLDIPVTPQELGERGIHALLRKPWQWADFARFLGTLLELSPQARRAVAIDGPHQFPSGSFAEFAQHRTGPALPSAQDAASAPLVPGLASQQMTNPEVPAGTPMPVRRDPTTGRGFVDCPHCDAIVPIALPSGPPAQREGPSALHEPPALTEEEEAEALLAYLDGNPRVRALLLEAESRRLLRTANSR